MLREIGRDDVKTQCCGVSLVSSVCVAVVVLFSRHLKTVCRFTVSLHRSLFVDTQNSTCFFWMNVLLLLKMFYIVSSDDTGAGLCSAADKQYFVSIFSD